MIDIHTNQIIAAEQERVRNVVRSLEVCWLCDKVTECNAWILRGKVTAQGVWICYQCGRDIDAMEKRRGAAFRIAGQGELHARTKE